MVPAARDNPNDPAHAHHARNYGENFNTTYRARSAADGNLRFTVTPNNAFYATPLTRPGPSLPTPCGWTCGRTVDDSLSMGDNGGRTVDIMLMIEIPLT